MSKRELDFSVLDEPKRELDFSPLDAVDKTAETWRDVQRAKFPTNEELGGAPGSIKEATKPWSIYEVGKTALEDLNPLNIIRPFAHPTQTAEDLGRAREHSETEAGKAWAEKNYPAAVTRGMLNMIPVVGPMIANAAEEGGTDPSKLAGHVTAAIAAQKIYGAATESTPLASAKQLIDKVREGGVRGVVVDVVNNARGIDPASSLFRALRPRNFVRDADKRIAGAMPEINAGAELTGKPPTDLGSVNEAIEAQIDARLRQQKALIGNEKFAIAGRPIADAVWNSMPKLDLLRMGEEAKAALHESIYNTWDRDFTPQELAEYLKDSNASRSVQGYFAKLPGQQIALDRVADKAGAMAENGAIRSALIDGLDNYKGTGQGVKEVNGALRDLISTKDLLDRRYNVEMRQAVQNLPQQASKLLALGRYGAAAKALLAGSPGTAAVEALTGLGEQGVANFLREINSTNGQIASAFRRFKDTLGPVPINPVSRYQRALNPASSRVEPRSETGSASPGSLSAQSQWQGPEAVALPQGLRDDPDVFMQTGSGETTQRMRDLLNAPALSNRTDLAARARPNLFTRPVEEPPIDVPFTATPRPDLHMPAAQVEPQKQITEQANSAVTGRKVTPMGDGGFTQRELLNIQDAEYEIQRDPNTGRFKKVYKNSGGKKTPSKAKQ